MNIYKYLTGVLMLCIIILVGCSDDDNHDAMLVVESFHNQWNLQNFDEIYTGIVSKEFKDSMTKSDYLALMDKNSLVLGKYQYGRLLKNEKIQALVGGNNVKLIYHSTYANYELNELFLMKKENGKYKIKQMVYDDIHVIKLNERQQ